MAQLVVRDLPDDVKSRLKERAKAHGRSLAAEVREILREASSVSSPKVGVVGECLADRLLRQQAEHPVPAEVWEEFDRNIAELRRSWTVREVDFGE